MVVPFCDPDEKKAPTAITITEGSILKAEQRATTRIRWRKTNVSDIVSGTDGGGHRDLVKNQSKIRERRKDISANQRKQTS